MVDGYKRIMCSYSCCSLLGPCHDSVFTIVADFAGSIKTNHLLLFVADAFWILYDFYIFDVDPKARDSVVHVAVMVLLLVSDR